MGPPTSILTIFLTSLLPSYLPVISDRQEHSLNIGEFLQLLDKQQQSEIHYGDNKTKLFNTLGQA